MNTDEHLAKHIIDGAAAFGAFGAFFNFMPNFAAFLAVCWYIIRIAEWIYKKFKNDRQN